MPRRRRRCRGISVFGDLLLERPCATFARMDEDQPKQGRSEKPPTPRQLEEQRYWADPASYGEDQAATIWRYEDTGHDLSIEEQLFCRSYIIDRNPVATLRRLNYAGDNPTLKRRAEKFLANSEVQACVETLAKRLMERLDITAEQVQRRIASVAFFDPRSVMSFDQFGVQVLHSRFWTEEQARNIQSIKQGPNGVEIKFYDSLRASEMLAKQLGVQPEEGIEAAAAASKAAAEAVVNKIFDVFERTIPEALSAPDDRSGETLQ